MVAVLPCPSSKSNISSPVPNTIQTLIHAHIHPPSVHSFIHPPSIQCIELMPPDCKARPMLGLVGVLLVIYCGCWHGHGGLWYAEGELWKIDKKSHPRGSSINLCIELASFDWRMPMFTRGFLRLLEWTRWPIRKAPIWRTMSYNYAK